ncbi:hypothetical protein SEEM1594_03825 [Salmonella enterica subsp. enterica serovar Muenchen str. baa1594]|nr:hypothetical protein SEEM1594_03825 [Salmonella enterica subsp. enterica serovar Muenchen str. baa1594]
MDKVYIAIRVFRCVVKISCFPVTNSQTLSAFTDTIL